MSRRHATLALLTLGVAAGCQTESQMLNTGQGSAVQTAVRRGQFEMACPQASGTVISRTVLQPALWGGIERAEYTIGMDGCGKRATYVVICPLDSTSCFAAASPENRAQH